MNDFQKKVVARIEQLGVEFNSEFILTVPPLSLNYETGVLLGYQVWIHPEGGADFSSEFYDNRFEREDFKNEDQLIAKLIFSLREGIINQDFYKKSPHKSPAPLFNRAIDNIRKLLGLSK